MKKVVLWTWGVLSLFLCAAGCDDSRLNDIPDPCEGKEIKPELCDGIDNDCDPATIDGAEEPLLGKPCDGEDSDFCEEGFWICDGYNGMICTDETDDNLELCDGKDNDCDPSTPDAADESSLGKPCDGPDSDLCEEGIWECGAYGMACTDDTGDKPDLCDGEDNDCNPDTPDGADEPSFGQACDGTDKDLCEEGIWECGTEGLACSDNTDDNLELCDGKDNDCDPATLDGADETQGEKPCDGPDNDSCTEGIWVCDANGSRCTDDTGDNLDLCDGSDNDCNPDTPDGADEPTLGQDCDGGDQDRCNEGKLECQGSKGLVCNDNTDDNLELCDGKDNDCDPATLDGADEPNLGQDCDGLDEDRCQEGKWVCAGSDGLSCTDETGDIADLCDGEDNDCNPDTPDGADEPTLGQDCDGEDQDQCKEGKVVCQGSKGLVCNDNTGDNLELCDGKDNDCDPNTPDGADVLKVPILRVCDTSWDRRPIVEFDPLPANHQYELYKNNDADPFATITLAGQNYYRPPNALGAGGPPPGTSMTIHVVSCVTDTATCCGTSEPINVRLIEECITPVQPSSNNIAISEYVINGDGLCPGDSCEAGEAFEITNLSHCPVSLSGNHFSYCNADSTAIRWMNFDNTAVIPPRGVYVAIRNVADSNCDYPFFGPNDPGIFGLNVSVLQMDSDTTLMAGWFNNDGGGKLRVASGWFVDMTSGTTFYLINSYRGDAPECQSVGFNAWDACGNVTSVSIPNEILNPNQLGRLWHPCDAVLNPVPANCRN